MPLNLHKNLHYHEKKEYLVRASEHLERSSREKKNNCFNLCGEDIIYLVAVSYR